MITLLILFAAPALSDPAATEPVASPSATVLPADYTAGAPLLPVEKKALLAQFKKSLADEDHVQDRLERTSAKEFSTSQSQELKDWRNQEKKTRRAYFDSHLSGPDRRDFVQGYIARKKAFDQKQKDDLSHFKTTLKEKHEQYKTDQKTRDTEFKAAIDRNERPARSHWGK